MACLAVTRFFDPSQETKYQARRYKKELIKHQLDRTQIANTCSKVITLAQIQIRDNDDNHDEEERIPEELREKNRMIIHEMGVTEWIYKDIEYHGKSEKVVRAGLECLSILVQHQPVITFLKNLGIQDERLYYRRLNKIPGEGIRFYKPKPRRGLAGMVTKFKTSPEYLALHSDENDDEDTNISQAQIDINKVKKNSAFLSESSEAIEYINELELCPFIPLKLKIWIYRFKINDHVQTCAGRFSSAFRGFYHPFEQVEKIRREIKAHYDIPKDIEIEKKIYSFQEKSRRHEIEAKERKESEEKKKKKRKKKSSDKYKIYQQRGSLKEHPDEQYDQFKLKKGDRVMCKAFKWWPRWYDGIIGEVIKPDAKSTSVEERYTVEFDDGEVCTMVDEYKIKRKQLNKFHAFEYMLSLCGIISSARWMINTDLCTKALYAIFLLIESKNENCNANVAVNNGILTNIVKIMQLHHEDANVQIKCSYIIDAIARSSIKNCKAVANAGCIQYVMDNLKGIKFSHSTLDVQKASLWVVDALARIRSNLEDMESKFVLFNFS